MGRSAIDKMLWVDYTRGTHISLRVAKQKDFPALLPPGAFTAIRLCQKPQIHGVVVLRLSYWSPIGVLLRAIFQDCCVRLGCETGGVLCYLDENRVRFVPGGGRSAD